MKNRSIGTQKPITPVYKLLERETEPVPEVFCAYPDCHCPFDAPADENWCAKGFEKKDCQLLC